MWLLLAILLAVPGYPTPTLCEIFSRQATGNRKLGEILHAVSKKHYTGKEPFWNELETGLSSFPMGQGQKKVIDVVDSGYVATVTITASGPELDVEIDRFRLDGVPEGGTGKRLNVGFGHFLATLVDGTQGILDRCANCYSRVKFLGKHVVNNRLGGMLSEVGFSKQRNDIVEEPLGNPVIPVPFLNKDNNTRPAWDYTLNVELAP